MGLYNNLRKQLVISSLIFIIFNTEKAICDSGSSGPASSPNSCPEAEAPYSHISAPSSSFPYQDTGSSPDASPNGQPSTSPISAPTPSSSSSSPNSQPSSSPVSAPTPSSSSPSSSPSMQPASSPKAESPASDSPSPSPSVEEETLSLDDESDDESEAGYDLNSLKDMVNVNSPNIQGLLSTAADSASEFIGTSKASMNSPEVQKLCDSTGHPDLCVGSIAPFFNGNTDTMSVLEMSIKSVSEITKLAAEKAKSLASTSGTSAETAAALEQCQEDLDDVTTNLQSALDALPAKDVGTINTMLSAAITDIASCGDAFGGENPLKGYDEKITNMTSNCLAIAATIK